MRQRALPSSRTHGTVASGESSGISREAGQGLLRHTDRCRGNAVASPSVKVGTAPDTPPRGQVLARHLRRDRLHRRAWSVTLRQLSGSPLPPRPELTRGGLGEPGAGGGPGRAIPAVWARSETPAPAKEPGLQLRSPAAGASSAGSARERGTGESTCRGGMGIAGTAVPGPADSPDRDTGSTGRMRGRRPLPGKDPS